MLQNAGFRALAEQVAGRVHPSVADDAVAAERHRDVILTHLAVGVAPFAALPALLAFDGAPTGAGLAAFAWLVLPTMIALGLSRNGRLDNALSAIAIAFAGFVAIAASGTGGLASPALALLALPLIDAALAGSRRGGAAAALSGLAALVCVGAATPLGLTTGGAVQPALAVAAGGVGSIYMAALALRAFATARAAELARAPNDGQFAQFAGSVDDLVTRHAASGAVTFASAAARGLLEVSPRELGGQGLFGRVHIADRPAFLQALSAAAERGDAPPVELRARVGSGPAAFLWIEMRARRVRAHEVDAASAGLSPVVATFRSVAERKAYEIELVEAREEAERASIAKTRFLAHMSHELRTPLNAIIGFSEVLSDEMLCRLTPERRADYATLIHRSGSHLLEVVNSILDMAKIESGAFAISPRACALAPLVSQCLEVMALKAETAGVGLAAQAYDAPDVEADPRAVTQIVLNLLANAIKFTPRGGDVTVSLASRQGGVALTVRDTGVGIAPENIGRLGEAFYQADDGGRRHEGAGLGLSVVRGLVALHGGDVAVESALGRGTAVTVFLPGHAPRAEAVPTPIDQTAEKVKLRA